MTAFETLSMIGSFSSLLPITAGLLRFKGLNYGLRSVFGLAVFSLLVDLITRYLYRSQGVEGFLLSRIYTVFEFFFITIFFLSVSRRRGIKIVLIAMMFVLVGIEIIDTSIQGLMQLDNLAVVIGSTFIIGYSVLTFYYLMRDMVYPNLLSTPQFWVLGAILTYFGVNLFVFASSNSAASSLAASRFIWSLHAICLTVFNILLTLGLWKAKPASR
jgi:hypothetical protein